MTDVSYSDAHICQAQCTADGDRCKAYTYVRRPPLTGSCCLKGTVGHQNPSSTCTSGVKAPPPGSVSARVGSCAEAMAGTLLGSSGSGSGGGAVALRADGSLTVRILPDRSVADFFVNGGAWAATQAWVDKGARAPGESSVLVWGNAAAAGVTADIDAWGMGCGWADPSYTEHPTM